MLQQRGAPLPPEEELPRRGRRVRRGIICRGIAQQPPRRPIPQGKGAFGDVTAASKHRWIVYGAEMVSGCPSVVSPPLIHSGPFTVSGACSDEVARAAVDGSEPPMIAPKV